MKISELFETSTDVYDDEHREQYEKSGYWGSSAAGCLIIAKSTKRILLQLRSERVLQPLTWGVIGGACDGNETPEETVRREVYEETGVQHINKIIPAYIFKDHDFKYHNFIVIVENEFEPVACDYAEHEAAGYGWVVFGDWPEPLHFGVRELLNDLRSLNIIKNCCI